MRFIRVVFGALIALSVVGCATPYKSSGLMGGYDEKELEPAIWRLSYSGNGYTTGETVQTYWLYRAADLALQNGFDGFQILSNIRLVAPHVPQPVKIATASTPIFIPMYTGPIYAPSLQGDIRLLKLPFDPVPGKVFNAAQLRSELDQFVHGNKCGIGNVCPHVHHYIYDAPGTASPSTPTSDASISGNSAGSK